MRADEIVDQIATEVRSLLDDKIVTDLLYKTSDSLRTSLVKDRLCMVGKRLGFRVAASGCDADDGEWLYDMVWFEERDVGGHRLFVRQALALECEWRRGTTAQRGAEVDSDFQKLVQARADVRVWICPAPNRTIAEQQVKNCKDQIRVFAGTRADDRYALVILVYGQPSTFILETFSPQSLGAA